jgi:hypothetical protein
MDIAGYIVGAVILASIVMSAVGGPNRWNMTKPERDLQDREKLLRDLRP